MYRYTEYLSIKHHLLNFNEAWFTSAAVTGRAIAAAALLGVLDGCSSSLDFFVVQGCGNTATRQEMVAKALLVDSHQCCNINICWR